MPNPRPPDGASRLAPRVFVVAAALWACNSLPLMPGDVDRIDAGLLRWNGRGYSNYSIEVVHYCECPPSLRDRARVEVVNGTIRQVTLLSTLAVITDGRLEWWRTVEETLADLREADSQQAWLAQVTFSLDPALGFPAYVHWTPKPGATELERIVVMRDPRPLATSQDPR